MIFNDHYETMPQEELKKLQIKRLQNTLHLHVWQICKKTQY